MLCLLTLGVLLAAPVPAGGADFGKFDDFLARLRSTPAPARAELTRRYVAWQREQGRLHMGSWAGGRISLAVILERPDLFWNAGLLSPSLAAPPHYYEPYFTGRRRPDPHLRVWLSAGSYEEYVHEDARMLDRYLRTTGVALTTTYTHEGHSLAAWRNLSPGVLRFFFGSGAR